MATKNMVMPPRDFLFTAVFRRRGQPADVAARLRDRLAAAGLDADQLLRDAADNDYIMWAFVAHRRSYPSGTRRSAGWAGTPLMTGPAGAGRFSAGVPVELATGAGGTLHAYAERMPDGALVTVLELRGEQPGLAGRFLRSLTPREAEVAGLVVEGLTDREIARRLLLSPYTVMQHVKSVYRKLGVDSRVALTRLLTGASPGSGMR
jgi:DNA-binding CsgD family transcriptional regulator